MATTKKKTPKPTKKASAKPSNGAKASAPRKITKKTLPKSLSLEEKQRLLKPIDGFTEIGERFVAAWAEQSALKVAGLSPNKLSHAIKLAKKSLARENAMRAKLEEKLRPLADARLLAEHEAWKMVLDAYAVAKALARVNPEIGHAFAFVGQAMTTKTKKKSKNGNEAEKRQIASGE